MSRKTNKILHKDKRFGYRLYVYRDRIELWKRSVLWRKSHIPLKSIAGVSNGNRMTYNLVIETTGGKEHKHLVKRPQKTKEAIMRAISESS